MPDPHDPLDPHAATSDHAPAPPDEGTPPSLLMRGGRPSKLTPELVATTMDELRVRDGVEPSVRRLQEVLGGGRTRLTVLRDEIRGARLVAAATPAGGSLDKALADVVAAAFKALGIEAARASDAAIEAARTDAEGRVEAAERVRDGARRAEDDAALERERALGRVGSLEETLAGLRDEQGTTARTLATAREHVTELRETAIARDRDLAGLRDALDRAEAEKDALRTALTQGEAATTAAAERLRADHATERAALTDESAAMRTTNAAQAIAIAESNVRLEGALARASELGARIERLEPERDAARERAERLDARLEVVHHEGQVARTEANAARRTVLELHARLARLEARLAVGATSDAGSDGASSWRVDEEQTVFDFGGDAVDVDRTDLAGLEDLDGHGDRGGSGSSATTGPATTRTD